MINSIKKRFSNGWLFPRYIGIVYLEPAMKEASEYSKGILLDIGCGMRRYESLFLNKIDRYFGLDWPQFDERTKHDLCGDALNLPIKNSSIDTVIATELMEHLSSPDVFLAEAERVLRVGGYLILSVPFMEPLHEEPRDYYRFTPYSLKYLLSQHGFLIQRLWARGGWWSVVLGSFVNQAIYDLANPMDNKTGRRPYGFFSLMVLPLCAIIQFLAYQLDRIFVSRKYTLGYTVVAVKE